MEKFFIPGTDNKYEITTEGQIISYLRYPKGKVLKPHVTENGYLTTTIKQYGKFKTYYIHRLVAQIFIPNPENLPYVNHLNEVKTDNRKENLEWSTAQDNCNYSIALHINDNVRKGTYSGTPIRVAKLDKQGNLLKAYYSIKTAARDVAGDNWNSLAVQINKIVHGVKGHHTAGGYRWIPISDEQYIQLLREHEDWIPENSSAVHLKNYLIREVTDIVVRKYDPKTKKWNNIITRVPQKENKNSVELF